MVQDVVHPQYVADPSGPVALCLRLLLRLSAQRQANNYENQQNISPSRKCTLLLLLPKAVEQSVLGVPGFPTLDSDLFGSPGVLWCGSSPTASAEGCPGARRLPPLARSVGRSVEVAFGCSGRRASPGGRFFLRSSEWR